MKKIIFKYTVLISGKPEIHYVAAYTEELAKRNLAIHLNVNADILRLSKKNLPFKVRAAIRSGKEPLTLNVDEKPEGEVLPIEEQQIAIFDLKTSLLNTLKYKVMALSKMDEELLMEYECGVDTFHRAYNDLRHSIIHNGFENETFDNGIHIIDILDSLNYSVHISKENYEKLLKHHGR